MSKGERLRVGLQLQDSGVKVIRKERGRPSVRLRQGCGESGKIKLRCERCKVDRN